MSIDLRWIVIFGISFFYIPFILASGRTVGNGGDVIVCKDKLGSSQYELLDFYEGRKLHGVNLDLGSRDLTVVQKLDIALIRLARVSPHRAELYRQRVASFFSETLFLADVGLVDIPDSDHIVLPANCVIAQIANQTEPLYPEDKRYIIDKNLWDHLDNDNQAGLILHEIIYREALSIGQTNSISVRLLNSNITSLRIESMTVQQFTIFLQDLGFTTNTIQGVDILLGEPVKFPLDFYPNGILKSAWVSDAAWFDWEGQRIKLRRTVYFSENGNLVNAFLRDFQEVTWKTQKITLAPYEIAFYESSKLKSLTLDSPIHWLTKNLDLSLNGELQFYESGNLAQAKIKNGNILFLNNWIPIRSLAVFYENGLPKEIELVGKYDLPWQNKNYTWLGRLEFNAHGAILNGSLAEPTDILTHGLKIRFKPFYPISFFKDSHEIESGCLGQSVLLKLKDGTTKKIDSGQLIRWEVDDNVQVEPYKSC